VAGEESRRDEDCSRLLIEGNVIENNWSDAQNGFASCSSRRTRTGTAPWTTSSDVTIRYNHIRNTGSVFNLSGYGRQPAQERSRGAILVTHNLAEGVAVGPYKGEGVAFQVPQRSVGRVVTHNTIINQNVAAAAVVFDGAPMKRS
jgi:hypothetical protein